MIMAVAFMALVSQASVPVVEPAAPVVKIAWHADVVSSHYWILQELSRNRRSMRREWEKKFSLDSTDQMLLKQLSGLQRRYTKGTQSKNSTSRPSVHAPLSGTLLPPTEKSSGRFLQLFLGAKDLEEVIARGQFGETDAKLLERVFSQFETRLTELTRGVERLEEAASWLEASAKKAQLERFLGRVSRFYASGSQSSSANVFLVWAPPRSSFAIRYGTNIILPLSEADSRNHDELDHKIGVVAHEFGHACASQLEQETKDHVTNRLYEAHGLVNAKHPNVFEEATQTALGNIVFMKEWKGKTRETAQYYSWERGSEYPDAIDSLARAIAPLVEKYLSQPGSYSNAFLSQALGIYAELFPARPKHHTRAGIFYFQRNDYIQSFAALFPEVDWKISVGDVDGFVQSSKDNSTATRWAFVDLEFLQEQPDAAEAFDLPWLTGLAERLQAGASSACIRAKRRHERGGFDFVVLARNQAAMRKALIELHRHDGIPEHEPIFID